LGTVRRWRLEIKFMLDRLSLVTPLALAVLTSILAGCGGGDGKDSQRSRLDEIKSRGTLRAGIRTDFPPHSSTQDGRVVGFDVDIARGVARNMGVKLEIVPVDELTRITFLKNGKIDVAVASINHTLKRDREIDFSKTYFFSHQSFLIRRDGGVRSLRDLFGKRVGASRGSSAIGNWSAYLERNGFRGRPEIVEFGDKQAAVRAVRSGAIAGYTEDSEVLATFAARNRDLVVLLDEFHAPKHDGIGVRQNDSGLLDAVNMALTQLQTSGEYDRIYDRWFGPGSEVPFPRRGSIEVWPEG
jgi:polar amino acid transport system substrate-binding protein